MPPRKQPP
jgi:phage shock protein A